MDKSDTVLNNIKSFLQINNVKYKYFEHTSTPTSEMAALVRGVDLSSGAKAIILKTSKSGKNLMVVLPGNLKIDSKKVKAITKEDIKFEDPDIIFNKFGIIIGGIPPFANLLNSNMLFLIDSKLFNNKEISFNCGKSSRSITMLANDYKKIVQDLSIIDEFTKVAS